ncbi:uncharacterized protein LOC119652415 isoform X2 [Hermetia illucens]|uniref:uncharacterized protein LOC119652415 isoform X2 n=1 Tax=Hermetia illucens TaxID=343691 RepID=UPI0018CBFF4E|nr:uncharacterized protein LOC119652415 isoform X2 [Hermetia illucens]
MVQILVLLFLQSTLFSSAITFHCLKHHRNIDRFHLLRKCQRSLQSIVGLNNTDSARDCGQFTKSVKGLAFNYRPSFQRFNCFDTKLRSENKTSFPRKQSHRHILDQPEQYYNCLALSCPEIGNLTTLVGDSHFNYYTLYANPIPSRNITCIPELGLFEVHDSLRNFSAALTACSNGSGTSLAHVISEDRTNGFADLMRAKFSNKKLKVRAAYVGLNYSTPSKEFQTTKTKENLLCYTYRAWAPGYPRNHGHDGCVAVTTNNSWVTTDCTKPLPFICEIHPSAPINEELNFFL